nr:CRE-ZTF-8 protein [Haemonchus contortus]
MDLAITQVQVIRIWTEKKMSRQGKQGKIRRRGRKRSVATLRRQILFDIGNNLLQFQRIECCEIRVEHEVWKAGSMNAKLVRNYFIPKKREVLIALRGTIFTLTR